MTREEYMQRRKKMYRARIFEVYQTIYDVSKKGEGIRTSVLAKQHHRSRRTIERYVVEMKKMKLPIKRRGHTVIYYTGEFEGKAEERDRQLHSRELEEEHRKLLDEGGSPIIEDIEQYYRSQGSGAGRKIQHISPLSLTQEEKDHIKRHLGG